MGRHWSQQREARTARTAARRLRQPDGSCGPRRKRVAGSTGGIKRDPSTLPIWPVACQRHNDEGLRSGGGGFLLIEAERAQRRLVAEGEQAGGGVPALVRGPVPGRRHEGVALF